MSYVSTRMGDYFSALLVSLMALQLALMDQNPFRPCSITFLTVANDPLVFTSMDLSLNPSSHNMWKKPTYYKNTDLFTITTLAVLSLP